MGILIPLHRRLGPDQQRYLVALVEWQRATDLAEQWTDIQPAFINAPLTAAAIELAQASETLSWPERHSIKTALQRPFDRPQAAGEGAAA